MSLRTLATSVAPISPSEGDLKVWWIPQVPGRSFKVAVSSPPEGRKVLDTLAAYDGFQFLHHIKPDYANAGGLMVYEDGEWVDYDDEAEGR